MESAATTSNQCRPQEVPSGMDQEAQLLDAFNSIPVLTKAVARPAKAGGVQLMVSLLMLAEIVMLAACHSINMPYASWCAYMYVIYADAKPLADACTLPSNQVSVPSAVDDASKSVNQVA